MKKKIVLIGGGGHCKVVIGAIRLENKFQIYGIVDTVLSDKEVSGVKVIGNDDDLPKIFKKGIKHAFICVGSIGNCEIRKKIFACLSKVGFKLPVICHPSAIIAKDVEIKEGTFVAAGVVINSGTKIGRNAIINTSSSIDHDCEIGDFVHVAPGVILCGGVIVKDGIHVGVGAHVIQNLSIEKFIPSAALVYKAEDGMTVWATIHGGTKL
jgi:UDP-perosamine 4-acetyltransferase